MTTPLAIPDEMIGREDLPDDVKQWIGLVQYQEAGEFPVERGYIWTSAASVENGNPLFWDDDVAAAITDGPIAMPTMLSLWFRPHHWAPGRTKQALPLQIHFDLKDRFKLPEAVMSDNTIIFHDPVRPGDQLRTRQILRSVSTPKTTKLGSGRFWVIEVEYLNQDDQLVGTESYTGFGYRRESDPADAAVSTPSTTSATSTIAAGLNAGTETPGTDTVPTFDNRLFSSVTVGAELPPFVYEVTATTIVLGALAARDWRPMHHDYDFAVNRNGTQDIFLNTPNQAAWFERYLTDWSGPKGRLGRMTFRMKGSVFPGDTMVFAGQVTAVDTDDAGCAWATVEVALTVKGNVKTTSTTRIALPTTTDNNPWVRRGDQWQP